MVRGSIRCIPALLMVMELFISTGCTPAYIQMDPGELATLKGYPEISVLTIKPSDFVYFTAGDQAVGSIVSATLIGGGVGGLVTGEAMIKYSETRGQPMVAEYSLEDPVLTVRDEFVAGITSRLELSNMTIRENAVGDDELTKLRETLGDSVLIDLKTVEWGLFTAPLRFSQYYVEYVARGRLVNLREHKILWQTKCAYRRSDRESPSNWDELTANSGKLMKEKLKEHAVACARALLSNFLSEDAPHKLNKTRLPD